MSIEAMKQMVEALERYDLDYEERLPIIRAGYKAIEEAEKQEPVDWKRFYELEKKKKEAIEQKYERDIAKLPRIIPMEAEKQEPVSWGELLKEADQIVRGKVVWKRFIDGTPLSNDVPVWMAEFAHQYANPPKREWQNLTDDEIKDIIGPWGDTPIKGYTRQLFDKIEAKLKEKNT